MNNEKIADGIYPIEDTCACGHKLRLHAYTFKYGTPEQKQRYYVDCLSCGNVTEWFDTTKDAITAARNALV